MNRPPGQNTAGVITGVVNTPTAQYPEGMTRVVIFGDPNKALGTVAVAECARIAEAVELAGRQRVPVEWFALSSGATIAMDSGTENMDGVAAALREIVAVHPVRRRDQHRRRGHQRRRPAVLERRGDHADAHQGRADHDAGSAMVLTGKNSLDYSGGVSAEDNFGIGGYDRVMGPNGEAQYWAPNLTAAVDMLFEHYEHAYVAPGERYPRRAATTDPLDRDVRTSPHRAPGQRRSPPSARSSPRRRTRTARSRSTSAP